MSRRKYQSHAGMHQHSLLTKNRSQVYLSVQLSHLQNGGGRVIIGTNHGVVTIKQNIIYKALRTRPGAT